MSTLGGEWGWGVRVRGIWLISQVVAVVRDLRGHRRFFSVNQLYKHPAQIETFPSSELMLQWYPKGGFNRVPATLQTIAEKHGAKFHFSTPVKSVTYNNQNKATGVLMPNGERKTADIVVVNADLTWAYNNLFVKEGETGSASDGANGNISGRGKVEEKKLLDPKKARSLLEKPHS